jgi:hypothetical protein
MKPWTRETFFHTRIRIMWDDHAPSIDMPIGCLFGGGGDMIEAADVSGLSFKSLLLGFDGRAGTFYSYWPMPYWSRARIDIVNDGPTAPVELQVTVAYKPSGVQPYPREACGYFGARRTVDVSPDAAYYSRAFRAGGRGKVVGFMMYSAGYAMDGDEFTYLDGSRTPRIHGDGTEDDHNQGWGGYAVQQPCWGGLINGFQGGYRFYLNDAYLFDSGISILYEHSDCGGGRGGQKTDCTAWYYLAEPGYGNLKLTDELDVGRAASERKHAYTVAGETWAGTTSASYDKFEQGDPYPTTDDGRAFTNFSRFTVALDPRNEGVKLRRRTNRNLSHIQLANVYVDGRKLADSPWYLCDLPTPVASAFCDTEFEIPAAYTQGKRHVTLQVEHVAGQPADSNNEYYYWIYCYGKTRLAPEPPAEVPTLAAQDRAGQALEVSWSFPSQGVNAFVIERQDEDDARFRRVATVGAKVATYRDGQVRPLTSYRYRVRALCGTGPSPWGEITTCTGPTPAMSNLALGATATASSIYGQEYTPEKANDGQPESRWNSAPGTAAGEWLALDLGRDTRVDAVLLLQCTQWTRITAYAIQAWIGGGWQEVCRGTNMPDSALCRFKAVSTSKVRLVVQGTTGTTPTIREFRLFDSSRQAVP